MKFSVAFPTNWKVNTNQANNILLIALSPLENAGDMFQENTNILVERVPSNMSLDEYYKINIKNLKVNVQSFKELSCTDVTIGGIAGKKALYTFTMDSHQIKTLFYVVIKNKLAYLITHTSLPSSLMTPTPT